MADTKLLRLKPILVLLALIFTSSDVRAQDTGPEPGSVYVNLDTGVRGVVHSIVSCDPASHRKQLDALLIEHYGAVHVYAMKRVASEYNRIADSLATVYSDASRTERETYIKQHPAYQDVMKQLRESRAKSRALDALLKPEALREFRNQHMYHYAVLSRPGQRGISDDSCVMFFVENNPDKLEDNLWLALTPDEIESEWKKLE